MEDTIENNQSTGKGGLKENARTTVEIDPFDCGYPLFCAMNKLHEVRENRYLYDKYNQGGLEAGELAFACSEFKDAYVKRYGDPDRASDRASYGKQAVMDFIGHKLSHTGAVAVEMYKPEEVTPLNPFKPDGSLEMTHCDLARYLTLQEALRAFGKLAFKKACGAKFMGMSVCEGEYEGCEASLKGLVLRYKNAKGESEYKLVGWEYIKTDSEKRGVGKWLEYEIDKMQAGANALLSDECDADDPRAKAAARKIVESLVDKYGLR